MLDASLREDVRAAVTLAGTTEGPALGRRFRFIVPALAVLVAGVLGGGAFLWVGADRQPEPIASALSSYRSNQVPANPAVGPAPDLASAGLTLAGAGHGVLGGLPVDVYAYRGPDAARVFLYVTEDVFPEARGASGQSGMVNGWTAQDHGLFMLCEGHPVSFLLVTTDQTTAIHVDQALGAASTFALARSA